MAYLTPAGSLCRTSFSFDMSLSGTANRVGTGYT